MRFLCLHGIGTNSKIFRMQTAALRYEIADHHTYEFAEGTVSWPLAPELEALSNASDEHFAYYDLGAEAASSLSLALDQLETYLEAEGPFDGILAFSQGAGLAAMLLVRQFFDSPERDRRFKCAILFSPIAVYDPVVYRERKEIRPLTGALKDSYAIDIPIAVVYGSGDDRKQESEGFVSCCNPSNLHVMVHEGGHEIPGVKLRSDLAKTVHVIRRAIYEGDRLGTLGSQRGQ